VRSSTRRGDSTLDKVLDNVTVTVVRRIETEVLVVGGGPVGLALAMDLAWRGVDVTVAELRHRGEPPSVKCNHVSARSMEIFRRLGVARKVRDAGLPPDYPNDVVFRTTATGIELARILFSGVETLILDEVQELVGARGAVDGWNAMLVDQLLDLGHVLRAADTDAVGE
jgi:NADPH-dependent 2,4-dienoyl-CoA reductase/sulfur reductase-like enzyme